MAMPKINQSPANSSSPISQMGPDIDKVRSARTSAESGDTSAKVYNEAGSGSRPVSSRYPIPTSAPNNPRTLGRDPGGALKVTR